MKPLLTFTINGWLSIEKTSIYCTINRSCWTCAQQKRTGKFPIIKLMKPNKKDVVLCFLRTLQEFNLPMQNRPLIDFVFPLKMECSIAILNSQRVTIVSQHLFEPWDFPTARWESQGFSVRNRPGDVSNSADDGCTSGSTSGGESCDATQMQWLQSCPRF